VGQSEIQIKIEIENNNDKKSLDGGVRAKIALRRIRRLKD
jgi:hypothetical protein